MRRLIALCLVLPLLARPCASQSSAFVSPLTLASDDARLVDAFAWAARQASAFAFQGDAVGPWFEAALPGREAFCMRDVSHQVLGAHALGMRMHVRNMLHRFAEQISAERDWASLWEIDRHGRPAHADYRNDHDFWYNLPANFDVLDAAWRMYQWSGDPAYINDDVFRSFYDHSVTDYVERWALGRLKGERWADSASRREALRGGLAQWEGARGAFFRPLRLRGVTRFSRNPCR